MGASSRQAINVLILWPIPQPIGKLSINFGCWLGDRDFGLMPLVQTLRTDNLVAL